MNPQHDLERMNWQTSTWVLIGAIVLYWWLGWNYFSFFGFLLGFGNALINLFHDVRDGWRSRARPL